jgi:hypothetical protein
MGYTNKPFEELDVLDNFLMNAIATDEEVGEAFCRKVLSVLLQRTIGRIKIVAQYTLPAQTPRYRGIRMDVKIEEFYKQRMPRPPMYMTWNRIFRKIWICPDTIVSIRPRRTPATCGGVMTTFPGCPTCMSSPS